MTEPGRRARRGAPALPARGAAAALVPAVVLALLGIAQLSRGLPLWFDELYSAEVAALPLSDLAALVRDGRGPTPFLPDTPPSFNAPYYALLHLWLALPGAGEGELGLRLPSLACAVAAVGVLAALVTRLAGPLTGLVAGLLAATSPLLVEQSVEARSYGPALLAVALSAYGLHGWLRGGRPVLFGVAGAAAGLLHWFALPVVAGLALAGLLQRPSPSARRAAGLVTATAGAAAPTLALVVLSLSHGTAGSPLPPDAGARVPLLVVQDWALAEQPLLAGTAVAAAVGLVAGPRRLRPARLLAGCWLAVPVAVTTLLALVRPVYYPRYLLPAMLALAVLAALGAACVARPAWLRVALSTALVAASVAAALPRLSVGPKERGDELVALLDRVQRPGEAVVAADPRAALALRHYAVREAPRLLPDLHLPPDDAPAGAVAPVWLVRAAVGAGPDARLPGSDDDAQLAARGWRLRSTRTLPAITGELVLQQWGP